MARPGLDKNVKFRALVVRLGLPRPYVRGLLETLWDVANEAGNPVLGGQLEVEAAAEWPGEPGRFFHALADCRLIDDLGDGRWEIHDYWDHAPEYVKGRMRMEQKRRQERSRPARVRNSAEQCEEVRNSSEQFGTVRNSAEGVRNNSELLCHSQHPTPNTQKGEEESSPLEPQLCADGPVGAGKGADGSEPEIDAATTSRRAPDSARASAADLAAFERFWAQYPRKTAKKDALRAWQKLRPDESLQSRILHAIAEQSKSRQWREGAIPHPATWLNGERWEDQLPTAQDASRQAAEGQETRADRFQRLMEEEWQRLNGNGSPGPRTTGRSSA